MKTKILTLLLLVLFLNPIYSQLGFKKDSLQIKVYTEIKYVNSEAIDITVKKVFCNYCTEFQSKVVGEEGIRRSNEVKYDAENRLQNGIKRLALYIRVSKKDFAALKEEEEDNNNNQN